MMFLSHKMLKLSFFLVLRKTSYHSCASSWGSSEPNKLSDFIAYERKARLLSESRVTPPSLNRSGLSSHRANSGERSDATLRETLARRAREGKSASHHSLNDQWISGVPTPKVFFFLYIYTPEKWSRTSGQMCQK